MHGITSKTRLYRAALVVGRPLWPLLRKPRARRRHQAPGRRWDGRCCGYCARRRAEADPGHPRHQRALMDRPGFRVYWAGQSLSAVRRCVRAGGDAVAGARIDGLRRPPDGPGQARLGVLAQCPGQRLRRPAGRSTGSPPPDDRLRSGAGPDLHADAAAVADAWAVAGGAVGGGVRGRGPGQRLLGGIRGRGPLAGGQGQAEREANGEAARHASAQAYVLGPLLASSGDNIVAARTGAAWALGLDALSFLVSVCAACCW